ncbi:MAG: hypothetical protein ABID61_04690 [Candidatus Micrarchaeota archaeon]
MVAAKRKEKPIVTDFGDFLRDVFQRAGEVGGDALRTRDKGFAERVASQQPHRIVPTKKEEPRKVAVVPRKEEQALPPQVRTVMKDAAIIASEELASLLTKGVEGKRIKYKDWIGA